MNRDYSNKLAIKKRLEEYYREQETKNGLSGMEKILTYLPPEMQFRHLIRGIVIAHLELEKILELIAHHKPFTVVSGLNPSSRLHLGHKVLFDVLLELSKLGAETYVPLTDDESYVDGKVERLEDATKNAYQGILPVLNKMGFPEGRLHVMVDMDSPEMYRLAIQVSRYVSMRQLKSLFGEEALGNPGQVFYRGCVQLAQILMPQMPEYGGSKPTLIPVGIDQHPYILLARDVAKKMGLVPPSELVIRFTPSLQDPEKKMSKSEPRGVIYLDDSPEQIKKKIHGAYTGSVGKLEDHRRLGGVPEACSVFAMYQAFESSNVKVEEVYERYVRGELLMGELKEKTSELLIQMLAKYNSG